MAIDPKIIAQMRSASTQDDGSEGAVFDDEPSAPTPLAQPSAVQGEPTTGMPLPPLRGSPAQNKWATTIRANTLALDWPSQTYALLRSVDDSTWWIANKAIVNTLKFKPPAPHQCAGGHPPQPRQAELDDDVVAQQSRMERDAAARLSDAERWAKSVSQHPKLAEAAILAVLSRLYKGEMQARLRRLAREALEGAEHAVNKDTDAINRMILS